MTVTFENDNKQWIGEHTRRYYNDFHRKHIAPSRISKVVFEDIDMLHRCFAYDPDGNFRFIEYKWGHTTKELKTAQSKSFQRVNDACRDKKYYLGFFLIWSDIADFEHAKEITINDVKVTMYELIDFLNFKLKKRIGSL